VKTLQQATGAAVTVSGAFTYMCKTPAYVANAGEKALIFVLASCQNVPVAAGVGVRPAYNVNAGADTSLGFWHYEQNTGTVAGGKSNAQVQEQALTPGSSYVFSTALVNSNGAASWSDSCYCNTFVVIHT